MTTFVELLVSGISAGFVYALIAMGFVVIFTATEVVNFAHGSMLLVGVYLVAELHPHVGFLGAVLLGVAGAALLGLVLERGLVAHVRGADATALAILTIGVDVVLAAELIRRIGEDVLTTGDPWQDGVVRPLGIGVAEARIAAMAVALVLLAAFFAAFRYSAWGVAVRAAAEDGEAAALMGIRRGRVRAVAWMVAGGLAAVAGIFLAGFPAPGLTSASGLAALKAFPAAILGGLDSTTGAVVGGLAIGVAEALAAGYQDQLAFLGRGFGDVVPYVVMIAVLLVRPSGLFGTRELHRV
jgi:branched-chain amino acid transport system permease protein